MLIGDLALMLVAVLASYMLRLELGNQFAYYFDSAIWMMLVGLLIKPVVYYLFGLYRRLWVYASIQELRLIAVAVTTASIEVAIVMLALFSMGVFVRFPRSVLAIDWLLSLIFVGGLRLTFRLLAENKNMTAAGRSRETARQVLVIGAGDAGALVVRELQKNQQLSMAPVGFLDDDAEKLNHQIYGVPVVGKLDDLAHILAVRQVDEVIIAIPSAPGRLVRKVAEICHEKSIPFRTMPGIYELLGGRVSVSRLREVDIADLLRREPVHTNDELVGSSLIGRVVLVTGAGGSIGRELCRQIARWGPAELVMLGHGENSIFEALLEFQEAFPSLPVRPVIADVRDMTRLRMVFQEYRPQVVFHAAAHKHVTLMELNVVEAVTNNIVGTRNVVQAAVESHVERMVLISSDKAVRPANVMGATKRMAEMLVLDAANRTGRAFSVVRFGNVLGSRGSVVPLFKRQIAHGGPVTVRHPDLERYFMTIPEAVYLVLQAAAIGRGGETFVLNMGEQVRILDLAEDLIRLSGLEPGRDIEIVFTGIHQGEKLREELWDAGTQLAPTAHPEIFRLVDPPALAGDELKKSVQELVRLAEEGDAPTVMTMMDELIPGAAVRSTPPPDMSSLE